MTTKAFTSTELPNDIYHSAEFPQTSGSVLAAIHADCPAAWRYGDHQQSAAMGDGIAAHAALLEPAVFDKKFIRGIDEADYPNALFTGKDIEGWLKGSGIKGCSGKVKSELIQMVQSTGEDVQIFDVICAEFAADCEQKGLTVINPKSFDIVNKMRTVIFQNKSCELLADGQTEVSIIDYEDSRKCRLDFFGNYMDSAIITDYKTTNSAHPELFGNQALRMNYWLKMALQHDLFVKHFGEAPRVILLAQSKKPPYICQPYEMTLEQLAIGREQYQQAEKLYKRCIAENVWPAYGGGIIDLQTPSWAAYQFGFDTEDSIEIVE